MNILHLLKDLHNFLHQFLPSPVAVFLRYRFSPVDLDRLSHCRRSANDDDILQTFDVLTYNINSDTSDKPSRVRLILRAIFSSGASIIFLQETNLAWEKLLLDDAAALQYNYRYFHHPRKGDKTHHPDRPSGGISILSKYPLKDIAVLHMTKDVSGSVFPALLCKVVLPITFLDQPTLCISIVNVHLRPPVNLDGSAWLDTARKTEPIRLAEVKRIVHHTLNRKSPFDNATIIQTYPDIIAGDFNEDNFGAALSHLKSLGYYDALQQYVPRKKETHTWPFMRNMWTLRKRLDHILWRENDLLAGTTKDNETKSMIFQLKCLSCGVLSGYEVDASDHQPVLGRFGIVMR